jgi:hypothetical protein
MRKLRCDRQSPCNNCVDAAVECHVDTSPAQRGPKKGHLKALRYRIGKDCPRRNASGTLPRLFTSADTDLAAALERHIGLPTGGEDPYMAARSDQGPDDDPEKDQNLDWESRQLPEVPEEFFCAQSSRPPLPSPSASVTGLSTPVEFFRPVDIDFEDVGVLGVPIPLLPQLDTSNGAGIICPAPDVFGATDQLISPLIRADLYVYPNQSPILGVRDKAVP